MSTTTRLRGRRLMLSYNKLNYTSKPNTDIGEQENNGRTKLH
jgi:hypothetical protein